MNHYDAALPPAAEVPDEHEPRVRAAKPGTQLDAVYASRYYRLDTDGTVDVEYTANGGTAGDPDSGQVEQAEADETPPTKKRRKKPSESDEQQE